MKTTYFIAKQLQTKLLYFDATTIVVGGGVQCTAARLKKRFPLPGGLLVLACSSLLLPHYKLN